MDSCDPAPVPSFYKFLVGVVAPSHNYCPAIEVVTFVRLQAASSTISGMDFPLTVPVLCQPSTVFYLAPTMVDFSHSKAGSSGHLAAICPSFLQLRQHIGGFLAGSSASPLLSPAPLSLVSMLSWNTRP